LAVGINLCVVEKVNACIERCGHHFTGGRDIDLVVVKNLRPHREFADLQAALTKKKWYCIEFSCGFKVFVKNCGNQNA
jgi:hypothetical protein